MTKVILLVEDNPGDVELTLITLRESRIANEVVVARDGEEALDYLFGTGKYAGRDLRVRPSIVLLDLHLPKVEGLEVLARLRADGRSRCIPVIILTSSKEPEDIVESYNLGANSYVRKPVDFNEFMAVGEQIGLYWLALNEPPP